MNNLKIFSPGSIWRPVSAGVVILSIPMLLTAVNFGGQAALWEKVHWTVATWVMVYLGFRGWREGRDLTRRLRGLMTLGLVSYALGQIIWDIQWFVDYSGFPALSDVFYLGIAPFMMAAVLFARGRITPGEAWATYLDGGIIFVSLATAIFSLYGPRTVSLGPLAMIVLAAYPVVFLAIAGAGLVVILVVRARPGLYSPYPLLLGLILAGVCWVVWNHWVVEAAVFPGSWVGYGFSVAYVLVGLGVAVWEVETSSSSSFEQWARWLLWTIPIASIPVAVTVLVWWRTQNSFLRGFVNIGGITIIILAVLRQSLLLWERGIFLVREREVLQRLEYELSERQRVEEALKTSQARLEGIISTAINGIITIDEDQKIVLFNAAAERIFGWMAVEVIGQPLDILVPTRYRESHSHYVQKFGLSGKTVREKGRLDTLFGVRADGEEFPLEALISQMTIEGQKFYTVILQDITHHRQAEEALREAETRYRQLVEQVPAVVYSAELGPTGKWYYISPQIERLTGFSPEAWLEDSNFWFAHIHPEDQKRAVEVEAEAAATGHLLNYDYRLTTRDGRTIWVRDQGQLTPALDGSNYLSLGFLFDITEQKRTEAERQTLMQIMQGAITSTDLPEFFRLVQDSISGVIYAENFFIALHNKQSGLFEEVYSVDKYDPPVSPHQLGKSISAYVFRTGRPLLLTQERFDALLAEGEVDLVGVNSPSWLGVPLRTYEETLGVMVVQHYEEADYYTAYDVEFLSSIAGQIALVIERKRAEEAIQRRADEFAALYEISGDLAIQWDLPRLLETTITQAMKLLGSPAGGLFLYDVVRNELEIAISKGANFPVGLRLGLGEGLVGWIAESLQPLIVDDYQTWEKQSPHFQEMPLRAVVGVPMLYSGELIGVLIINELGDSERRFTDGDVKLLSLLAAQVAGAVYNARLFDATRRRLAEREAVLRVSTALRTAQTLDDMLPILLDETLSVLDAGAGSILLYDSHYKGLIPKVGRGWFSELDSTPILLGDGIAGHVFVTGEISYIPEFSTAPRIREAVRSKIQPGWSGVCVPVRTAKESVGVFFVAVSSPRQLSEDEIRLFTTLTEIAGNAIHRTRLHEQTQHTLHRLAALRAIDQAITSSFDLKVSLHTLLEQAGFHLNADSSAVFRLAPHTQTLSFVAGYGLKTAIATKARIRIGTPYAGQVALDRQLISIPEISLETSPDTFRTFASAEAIQAYHAAPLIAKGQVKGVLEIFHHAPFHPDADWLNFLVTLAGQAAIAMDNAELFEGLQHTNMELVLAYDATIEGWSRALDLRDEETEGHTRRVTEMAVRLAQVMEIGPEALIHLRRGALLHDIGKMGVPDAILHKHGPLTEEEWEIMRRHPEYAYEMLSRIEYLRPALDIPYCHHEKWDGSGYPRGLLGDQIPLAARIFTLVDVWDALSSDRPYRKAWPEEKVQAYIHNHKGTYFDPQIADVFLHLLERA